MNMLTQLPIVVGPSQPKRRKNRPKQGVLLARTERRQRQKHNAAMQKKAIQPKTLSNLHRSRRPSRHSNVTKHGGNNWNKGGDT